MILQEINYKMPIYRDCTLGELLSVGTFVFISELIFFSLLTRLFFGFAAIGVAITFISFFHVTKYGLTQLQKLKYGKPYGYYTHLLLKHLSERGFIHLPYVTRIGKWSIRRML